MADAVTAALADQGSCARGVSECDLSAARSIYACRRSVAALLGAPAPERVVFCANATQALNTALFGMVRPGERVVSTVMEHNSVLRPLNVLARRRGVDVVHVGLDGECVLDYEALERAVSAKTRLVVCTHASNLTGDVVDVARVSKIAHAAGALLVVDAAQTAGAVPIDMQRMGIDVLCFTGHKALMGPTGTGGLVAAPHVEIDPLLHGGTGLRSADLEQPQVWPEHLEAGTLNTHGIAGLNAAVDFVAEQGVDAIFRQDRTLRSRFVRRISAIPGICVLGAAEESCAHTAVVALNLSGMDSSVLADALSQRFGIATRAGLHCAPLMHRALGTLDTGAVRFSFGFFSTEEELDKAADALECLAAERGGRL